MQTLHGDLMVGRYEVVWGVLPCNVGDASLR